MNVRDLAEQLQIGEEQLMQIIKDIGLPISSLDDAVDSQAMQKLLEQVDKVTDVVKQQEREKREQAESAAEAARLQAEAEAAIAKLTEQEAGSPAPVPDSEPVSDAASAPDAAPGQPAAETAADAVSQTASAVSANPEPAQAVPSSPDKSKKKINPSLFDMAENLGVELDALIAEAAKHGVVVSDPKSELDNENGNKLLDNLHIIETAIKNRKNADHAPDPAPVEIPPDEVPDVEKPAAPAAEAESEKAAVVQSGAGTSSVYELIQNPYIVAAWVVVLFSALVFFMSTSAMRQFELKNRKNARILRMVKTNDREQVSLIWKMESEGFHKAALEIAENFKLSFPDSEYLEDVYFKIAEIQYAWKRTPESRQYQAAITAYQMALDRFPRSSRAPAACFMIGECYRSMNLPDMAAKQYIRLLMKYPRFNNADKAQYYLAQCYFDLRRYPAAIREYTRLLRRYPQTGFKAQAYLKIAASFEAQRQWKSALATYEKFLRVFNNDPRRDEVRFSIGQIYFNQGQFEKAIEAYRHTVAEYPYDKYNARAYMKISDANAALGRYDEAIRYAQELIYTYLHDPLVPEAMFKLAGLYKASGHPDKAIEYYRQALKRYPSHKMARDASLDLADILVGQKKNTEAIDIRERTVKAFPNMPDNDRLVFQILLIQYNDKKWAAASTLADRIARAYPTSPLLEEALYMKADSLFRMDLFNQAQKTYIKIHNMDQKSARRDFIFYRLGECSYYAGRYDEAIVYWEDGLSVSRFNDYRYQSHYMIAQAYLKKGDIKEAGGRLERIMRDEYAVGREVYLQSAFALAQLYDQHGEKVKVLPVLEILTRSWQGNYYYFKALQLKAGLYLDAGVPRKALAVYHDAISTLKMSDAPTEADRVKKQSDMTECFVAVADILYSQRDFLAALVYYGKVQKTVVSDARKSWALFQIGNCYAGLHRKQEAKKFYERLKKEYPQSYWTGKVDWYFDTMMKNNFQPQVHNG